MKDPNDLRGLDYFTQAQAARYMCRSLSKFKTTVKVMRIPHIVVDGVKMFRKTDLVNAIEEIRLNQWQHSENAISRGISAGPSMIGPVTRKNTAGPLEQ